MAGGVLLFLIVQLLVLGWAMFVAGRSGLLYKIQVTLILTISFTCMAIIAVGITGVIWFTFIQSLVFLGTGYVIYRFHPKGT